MRHDDNLYPLWLVLREALLDSLPDHLRGASAYTCGDVADDVVQRVRDHLLVRRVAALEKLAVACGWVRDAHVPAVPQLDAMRAALAAADEVAVPVGDYRPGRYAPERLAALEEVARCAGYCGGETEPEALGQAVAALRVLEAG